MLSRKYGKMMGLLDFIGAPSPHVFYSLLKVRLAGLFMSPSDDPPFVNSPLTGKNLLVPVCFVFQFFSCIRFIYFFVT